MKKQRGFTVVEVMAVLIVLGVFSVAGIGVYAVVNFVLKFW
ncbi:type II secretion system protein [Paraburkholderia caledonica]|uniref:Prepilin-type N-terminal cleavage/methylation domain-containing protein n=2 Tax=Paraburkholderia caledonica TaxID=134536 RepID=A0AB73IVJ9_9BURK|nr:prepilin-type N-terminal cleavage/methylation domain-containing protein [Paraburkholderia caledonica]